MINNYVPNELLRSSIIYTLVLTYNLTLGSVDKQSIEVTNCFCVPHKEYEERVEADLQYAQDMFELNKKVAPAEQLVGWFATGSEITSHSALIHDYYGRETKDPVHLTVDTTLNSGKVALKGYVL
jgi:translation initiation factor 3 subunit F